MIYSPVIHWVCSLCLSQTHKRKLLLPCFPLTHWAFFHPVFLSNFGCAHLVFLSWNLCSSVVIFCFIFAMHTFCVQVTKWIYIPLAFSSHLPSFLSASLVPWFPTYMCLSLLYYLVSVVNLLPGPIWIVTPVNSQFGLSSFGPPLPLVSRCSSCLLYAVLTNTPLHCCCCSCRRPVCL